MQGLSSQRARPVGAPSSRTVRERERDRSKPDAQQAHDDRCPLGRRPAEGFAVGLDHDVPE
jgi:hypothetical protein